MKHDWIEDMNGVFYNTSTIQKMYVEKSTYHKGFYIKAETEPCDFILSGDWKTREEAQEYLKDILGKNT